MKLLVSTYFTLLTGAQVSNSCNLTFGALVASIPYYENSVIRISSLISENNRLEKEAKIATKDPRTQDEMNNLLYYLVSGNDNPAFGRLPIGNGYFETRGRVASA